VGLLTKTKQLIKKNKIKFKELWDKPSIKGNPTKESVLITIAIDFNGADDVATGGFTIKVPGDHPRPKIGRAKAVANMYGGIFDIDTDCPESQVLDFFECRPSYQKMSNEIRNRIKFICGIKDGIIGVREY
jgi:hypothetical protein